MNNEKKNKQAIQAQENIDSEYEYQVQINMPHTEAGKYFRLYKGQKRVK